MKCKLHPEGLSNALVGVQILKLRFLKTADLLLIILLPTVSLKQ